MSMTTYYIGQLEDQRDDLIGLSRDIINEKINATVHEPQTIYSPKYFQYINELQPLVHNRTLRFSIAEQPNKYVPEFNAPKGFTACRYDAYSRLANVTPPIEELNSYDEIEGAMIVGDEHTVFLQRSVHPYKNLIFRNIEPRNIEEVPVFTIDFLMDGIRRTIDELYFKIQKLNAGLLLGHANVAHTN